MYGKPAVIFFKYQVQAPVWLRNRHILETYTVLWLKGKVKYYIFQTAPIPYRQPSLI